MSWRTRKECVCYAHQQSCHTHTCPFIFERAATYNQELHHSSGVLIWSVEDQIAVQDPLVLLVAERSSGPKVGLSKLSDSCSWCQIYDTSPQRRRVDSVHVIVTSSATLKERCIPPGAFKTQHPSGAQLTQVPQTGMPPSRSDEQATTRLSSGQKISGAAND